MADRTSAIPSVNEPVIDRYRRWSPVWYPWIKRVLDGLRQATSDIATTQQEVTTLSTTVGGNTASIEQIIESTDGFGLRWSIDMNVNNRVVGMVRLDGDASQSTFSVLATKFEIVHPTNNAQTIQAFVAGMVNGIATVGINGNLVVDGSIEAEKLNVSSISAIAADLGTVTAGRLQNAAGTSFWDLDTGEFQITGA